jgi:hypothetical protein
MNHVMLYPSAREQLPVASWSIQALAISFAGRVGGDSYRVLAANNGTEIYVNGTHVTTRDAGKFYDTIIDGPVVFQGSQPIQVAQFANGDTFDSASYGDPCEILLPPTGNYLTSYTVYVPPDDLVTGDFDESYLNLIVPTSAITATYVDGVLASTLAPFTAISGSSYSGAQISRPAGSHTVTSSQPVEVQVYGWGSTDAYGYFGGVTQ